jgi:hypothetical protein
MNPDSRLRARIRNRKLVILIVFLSMLMATVQCICSGTGACVGSGGSILHSPVCKEDWSRGECAEWDDENINDASWRFRSGRSCEGLGYTDECSDGSYRLPGACD